MYTYEKSSLRSLPPFPGNNDEEKNEIMEYYVESAKSGIILVTSTQRVPKHDMT